MKKLLGLFFGLVLLAGCSLTTPAEETMPASDENGSMEEVMMDDSMSEESLDTEVDSIINEEAAIDAELDALDAEF